MVVHNTLFLLCQTTPKRALDLVVDKVHFNIKFYAGCGTGGRRTCTCCSPAQLRYAPTAGCAAHACHAQRSYCLQARSARPFSIRVAFLVQPGVWHRSRPVAARHTGAPIDPVKPVVYCLPTCLRLSIPAHLWHAPAAGVRLMPFVPTAYRHRQCACKRAYRVHFMYNTRCLLLACPSLPPLFGSSSIHKQSVWRFSCQETCHTATLSCPKDTDPISGAVKAGQHGCVWLLTSAATGRPVAPPP